MLERLQNSIISDQLKGVFRGFQRVQLPQNKCITDIKAFRKNIKKHLKTFKKNIKKH